MRKKMIYSLVFIITAMSGCGKDENKEKYNVIKEHGVPLVNRQPEVASQYQTILDKDPKNYTALVNLGNQYFDTNKPKKAIEMYQRALKINPGDANVRTDMGVMYRRIGEFNNAVREFRKAADSNQRHVQSRYNLGIVYYYDLKNNKKAADAWEEVLKINPGHPEAANIKQFIDQIRNAPKTSGVPSNTQKGDGWIK